MDDLIRKYSEELQKTQRERNNLKQDLHMYRYALRLMAKQLCSVYYQECCSYGDIIAGDDADETAINYLNHAKELILTQIRNFKKEFLDQIDQGESK